MWAAAFPGFVPDVCWFSLFLTMSVTNCFESPPGLPCNTRLTWNCKPNKPYLLKLFFSGNFIIEMTRGHLLKWKRAQSLRAWSYLPFLRDETQMLLGFHSHLSMWLYGTNDVGSSNLMNFFYTITNTSAILTTTTHSYQVSLSIIFPKLRIRMHLSSSMFA